MEQRTWWTSNQLSERRKSVEKAPQGVLKLAEKATHEVTHEFRDWCNHCVQVKAANDPPQITTEEPEFPIIMTESRHESEIDLEEGQASHVVSSEVEQSRVWRRKKEENVEGVLKETGYAALKVCHQVYHCLETDSVAAIHSDATRHTDGESATRALGTVTQHARRKEMSPSVDRGIPQHQWSG